MKRLALLLAITLSVPVAASRAADIQLPPTRTVTLPNGARLILAEKREVPLISFSAYLQGGALTDPEGKEGLAALTAEMLRKGAGKRSAQQIAYELDTSGAVLGMGAGVEVTWISGEFLARDEGLMVDLLRNMLRNPTFPDSEFVKLKQQSIDALKSEKDDPNNLLTEYGTAFAMAGHPYANPVEGDEKTLERITREDVLAAYRAHYGGDRLILSIVGDFEPKRMEGVLRRAFGDWARAPGTRPVAPAPARARGKRVLLVDKPDATQTYFWIGNLGISRKDPDRDAVDIANTALGGRYTSFLNTALRIQSGLTYGARSRTLRLIEPGPVAITSYTKTESTQRAIDLAVETLERFRKTGLDSLTMTSVQNYLSGLHPTNYETSDQIASILAGLAHIGLPVTEITEYTGRLLALDSAKVHTVLRRVYPAREDLAFVLIGNASEIRPVAKRYGEVIEIRFDQPLIDTVSRAAKTR
ncbi:MAG TPA: pitrilysin family protein [Candidatus Eisenbacteria bacterium]|nr:pitrilysin family protein [Candidatus Eisenbacteria bacterium]